MNQSSTTTGNKIKYKIVLLGDQSVGKSSIIEKYIHNKFDQCSNPTVGIDFLAKNMLHKGKNYRLQLWDTAGQQRFKSLIPSYLKDAICAIIIFDVTNKNSLINAEKWLRLYSENKTVSGYCVLVGNKIDLQYRTVTEQEGRKTAQDLGIDYAELSAKTGQRVQETFLNTIDMLQQNRFNGYTQSRLFESSIKQTIKQQKREEDTTVREVEEKKPQPQKKPVELQQTLKPAHNIILTNQNVQTTTKKNTNTKCC